MAVNFSGSNLLESYQTILGGGESLPSPAPPRSASAPQPSRSCYGALEHE